MHGLVYQGQARWALRGLDKPSSTDGPERGGKTALASGRAQAQGLTAAGVMNYWIACQAHDDQLLDRFAQICVRSPTYFDK